MPDTRLSRPLIPDGSKVRYGNREGTVVESYGMFIYEIPKHSQYCIFLMDGYRHYAYPYELEVLEFGDEL